MTAKRRRRRLVVPRFDSGRCRRIHVTKRYVHDHHATSTGARTRSQALVQTEGTVVRVCVRARFDRTRCLQGAVAWLVVVWVATGGEDRAAKRGCGSI